MTKHVSAVTIHELQKLTLEREGKEVASLRVSLVEKESKVIPPDTSLAKSSGVLRSKYDIPLADSVIGATAMAFNLRCVTDNPHLKQIREIKTRWIWTHQSGSKSFRIHTTFIYTRANRN